MTNANGDPEVPEATSHATVTSLLGLSDRRHVALLAILVLVFTLGLAFRIHGWSISAWHNEIDGSPESEVLWGHAQGLRADDWGLELALILGQVARSPRFSAFNEELADGQYVGLPIRVPTSGSVFLFRPVSWGFVFGRDVGLAWNWWTLVLGTFYSFFLVFMIVSRKRFVVSILGSFTIIYSPFFQFWTFHKGEIAIHWAMALVAFASILLVRRRRTAIFAGLFLGWNLAGMAIGHIYPPIAVPMGWLLLFASVALAWDRCAEIQWRERKLIIAGALALGLVVAVTEMVVFFRENAEALHLVSSTLYPGQRRSLGGGLVDYWPLFSDNLLAVFIDRQGSWADNLAEASSFFWIFPGVYLAMLASLVLRRRVLDRWCVVLLGYFLLIWFFDYVGFPEWLGHLTLFDRSAESRTRMGLGVANAIVMVAVVSRPPWGERKDALWVATAAWCGLLVLLGAQMHRQWPRLCVTQVAVAVAVNGLILIAALASKHRQWVLAIIAGGSLVYTFHFNPIVQGGTDFILQNPLSLKIREIDRQEDGESRWVTFGVGQFANLHRMLGVNSFAGYLAYPPRRLFNLLDPTGAYESVWNQGAHFCFEPSDSAEATFASPYSGLVVVSISPESPVFDALGVRYFFVVGEASISAFERCSRCERIFTLADRVIYRRR